MGIVLNKVVVAVPHQYSYVVESFGKYQTILNPGLNFLLPFVQKVAFKHSMKEQSFQIKAQNAVTKDNVIMQTDGVLFLRVKDPVKCSYGAKDPISYMYILAQGVMRSEIGKLTLDQTFEEREQINNNILESLSEISEKWGLECLRYEIRDIKVSEPIKKVMSLEAESERKKRAEILKSEGKKTALINIAEAVKRGYILDAQGRSESILLNSEAQVERINFLANAIQEKESADGKLAAKYISAEKYIEALVELANPNKNIVLQNNISDPQEMVNNSMELLEQQKKNLDQQEQEPEQTSA